MPRRRFKKPADPMLAIAQRNTRMLQAEKKISATPSVWGFAPELEQLESSANVQVARDPTGQKAKARRLDAFDTLYARGGLSSWQYDAAQRLMRDLAEWRGVGGAGDSMIKLAAGGGGNRHAGNLDMVTVRMMAAGERLFGATETPLRRARTGVLDLVGANDRLLLLKLMEPMVWRDQVRAITGETEIHAQAARVRAALENLRLAYGIGPEPDRIHPFDAVPIAS